MRKKSKHTFIFRFYLLFVNQLDFGKTFSCLDKFVYKVYISFTLFYLCLENNDYNVEEADGNVKSDHTVDKVNRSQVPGDINSLEVDESHN